MSKRKASKMQFCECDSERIADGYYFSKTIRLLKKLMENPELLEQPLNTEVDYK